ncbi:MAG: hypothetical protein ACFFG0_13295 [Candidatus Thorarchaeota archaeon]
MNIMCALIKRTVVKKVAKKVVKPRVDKFWENNREIIMVRIKTI